MSWADDMDETCLRQAKNAANLPFIHHHLSGMPDFHGGYGVPIGTVLALLHNVVPNAIGVDIGCGMHAVRTNVKVGVLRESHPEHGTITRAILHQIQRDVPIGNGPRGTHEHHKPIPRELDELYGGVTGMGRPDDPPGLYEAFGKVGKFLGTLGGGNHFIELDSDEDGRVWLMLHSGSRAFGYAVCNHFNKLAKDLNERWYSMVGPKSELNFLPLDTAEGKSYVRWADLALEFAAENRRAMLQAAQNAISRVLQASHGLSVEFSEEVDSHHNYGTFEHHFGKNCYVIRKGAVRARLGDRLIIPGSMETGSFIAEGLGNELSFTSSPHGAGRAMSRTAAKKARSVDNMVESLKSKGIELVTDSVPGVVDEGAQAYKDIGRVMELASDLVKPLYHLSPLGVVKGADNDGRRRRN